MINRYASPLHKSVIQIRLRHNTMEYIFETWLHLLTKCFQDQYQSKLTIHRYNSRSSFSKCRSINWTWFFCFCYRYVFFHLKSFTICRYNSRTSFSICHSINWTWFFWYHYIFFLFKIVFFLSTCKLMINKRLLLTIICQIQVTIFLVLSYI